MEDEEYDWIDDNIQELLRFGVNDEEMDWIGRKVGTSGLHIIKRTVLMLAATYSKFVILNYILTRTQLEINKASSTDGLTALDCAYLYGADPIIVRMLESSGAKCTRPDDPGLARAHSSIRRQPCNSMEAWCHEAEHFMIFTFKVKSCTRNYDHARWNCPYLHSDEEITRRRELRRHNGKLRYGSDRCWYWPDKCHDACHFAHGDYEIWYHPKMFRTQMCTQKMLCRQMTCPNAHHNFELRTNFSAVSPSRNALDTVIVPARVTGDHRTRGFQMPRKLNLTNEQDLHGLMAAPNAGVIQFPSQAGIRIHQNMNPQSNPRMAVGYKRDFSKHSQSFTGREIVLHQHGQPTNSVSSSTLMPHRPQSLGFHERTLEQSPGMLRRTGNRG